VYHNGFLINFVNRVGITFIYLDLKLKTSAVERRRLGMTPYYVYIILCEGNNFYTGYTKNVKSRFRQHINGKGARYTKMHKPRSLAYVEEFRSRSEAMKRERRIKRLSHVQKVRLTNSYPKVGKRGKRKRAG
jgi:putative endonuclease